MDFGNIVEKANQLKKEFDEKQQEFFKKEFSSSTGGGLVEITLNGKGVATQLKLDKKLLDEDIVMIEDLILAAFNNAKENVDSESKSLMSDFAPNFNVPGLDKIF